MQTERRKNFRCPPNSDGETVVLRHNGIDQSAKVENVSAEGFRISFEAKDGVEPAKVDDVALLATRNGSHQVRVANVELGNGNVHLGLERLADFSRRGPRVRKIDLSKGPIGGGRRIGNPSSSIFVKVSLVVAIAVLGMVAINLTLTARGNSSGHPVAVPATGPVNGDRPVKVQAASETKTFQEPPAREQVLADAKYDASTKIVAALKRATRENKAVLIEFGTDQGTSSYRLRDFIAKNAEFAAAFQRDFVLVLVDKVANRAVFDRLVPAEQQNDASFTLLDKEGRPVKVEKAANVAEGAGFDIDKIKALVLPPKKSN